jgi:alkaline phosphatase D
VASGDPAPDGVVLWTRVSVAAGETVDVGWTVAEDPALDSVVSSGSVTAAPDADHTVHVVVSGLGPATTYWYGFTAGGQRSPIGRTRTLPAPDDSTANRLRLGVVCCSHWATGWFNAYGRLAERDVDLVVHLGDYIYESPTDAYAAPGGNVRHHVGAEATTLEAYRQRLAQYHTDPDLQAVHAAFPWVVTWDDHEVANNYAGDVSAHGEPPALFRARRAAAYQAYWEHMPLPPGWAGLGADLRLYRRFTFGRLAEINVLDTRQYRTDQPCGDRLGADCPDRKAPAQTITGPEQERWLLDGLGRSAATWNVLAQQVFLSQVDFVAGPGRGWYMDGWDGYVASRDRLVDFLAQEERAGRGLNPVVLTGDFHTNWMADLKANFDDPASATVGTEFVGTSISSGGDGSDTTAFGRTVLAENPHVHFHNSQRGYVRCTVTPQRWTADYRIVPFVSRPGAPVSTRASFAIEAGHPGAEPV